MKRNGKGEEIPLGDEKGASLAAQSANMSIGAADAKDTNGTNGQFSHDLIWLGERLVSATVCRGRFNRRDRKRLSVLAGSSESGASARAVLELCKCLGLMVTRWRVEPDETDLPMVVLVPATGYKFIYGRARDGAWLVEGSGGRERVSEWPKGVVFLPIKVPEELPKALSARSMFFRIFRHDTTWAIQAALASVLASILVLGTSLYSMQVYDRVIAQGGVATLVVLSVGVVIAILVEFAVKVSRSKIVDRAVHSIDVECAQEVFRRMLSVRLDQFPPSVGTLAAQVRGFETVRGFYVAALLYFLTDAPFALFFLFVLYLLAGPLMVLVPTVALIFAVAIGFSFKRAIQKHSARMDLVGNRRQGLLVEAIQGSELIKSSGGAWSVQARWNELSRHTSKEGMHVKSLNDLAGYFSAGIQQLSYVGLIATGAYLATTTKELSIGAIIACSIISGRVLTPVNQIPGLLVQWAHSRVAMENLEKLFSLQMDNHGVQTPVAPEVIKGGLEVVGAEFSYPGQPVTLNLKSLRISSGERVAILGGIGCGKSTLLKLLAGLIKAERGQILLDGIDIQQIAPERRSEIIGYLPQSTRLISGTLRENLIIGLPYINDQKIFEAAEATGLSSLLSSRSEGLDLRVSEGGEGLSGGQKQLVGLTRMLLGHPSLWLLDEPTASMDDGTEERCLQALRSAIQSGHTLVLVTHKLRMLELVDRIIVLSPQGVAIDGPSGAVLAHLRQGAERRTEVERSSRTG
ncbi:ATP-binding cassette, subfamily C, LapB [Pseudomonas sp. LAMO17WK12:I10]|uniref:ATP-binding cassette domain-containing protein n=1 Tax=unclassified Pseudomonas TaxID=196821 RepID=UPI000BC60FB9|nr:MULTISPECIES: ATP-binding cassette domain-containing protein [unclassified Pseudomonas]PXX50708.1 ATP-binding cassette subfamily C protein LapB [Pseudomonas sp. LAMO17WK12:I9]SNY54028.1 ATP-binding cassette, subfamily C, LapB [Pseudomonas sp. LAMO17WK12:I10]